MTMRTERRLIVCLALLILTTACSAPTTPPRPTTTSPRTTTTPRPTVAPPVTKNLDLTPVWAKPCDPISHDFLMGIGLDSPTSVATGRREALCIWESLEAERPRLSVWLEQNDPLGEAYRDSAGLRRTYFQPTTVAGLPAVLYSVNPDAIGICGIVVGTGSNNGITVSAGGDDSVNWCVKVEVAARQVVQFLGG